MKSGRKKNNTYSVLPSYAGITIATAGLIISAFGTGTMILINFSFGFFTVLTGWIFLLLGNIMDNTGLFLESNFD